MKNYFSTIKLLLSLHQISLVLFFSVQLFFNITLNLYPQEGFAEIIYAAWLTISISALIIYLGYYFNSVLKSNWIQRLPISMLAIKTLPILIILCFGVLISLFYPWKQIYKAQYIFTLGLPLTGYFIISQNRSLLLGITKALFASFVIILLWATLFWNWSMTASGLCVNLTYLTLFTIAWVLVTKNKASLIATAFIALCIVIKTGNAVFYNPKNFTEAVLSLDEIPIISNIERFKQFTQDENLWKTSEEARFPMHINVLSQIFSQKYLDDTQKIKFLENIDYNFENATKSHDYKDIKSEFTLPVIVANKYTLRPLGEFNISNTIKEFIYNSQKDTLIYMYILPVSKDSQYTNKLFNSKYGNKIFIEKNYFKFYIPSRKSDFDSQIEGFAKKNPKNFLSFPFLLGLDFRDPEIKDYIDKNDFEKLKPYIHTDIISELKKLPNSNQLDFYSALNLLDSDIQKRVSEFICFNIKNSCEQDFNNERLSKTNWWDLIQFNGLYVVPEQAYKSWINKELKKEENWQTIKNFLVSINEHK